MLWSSPDEQAFGRGELDRNCVGVGVRYFCVLHVVVFLCLVVGNVRNFDGSHAEHSGSNQVLIKSKKK